LGAWQVDLVNLIDRLLTRFRRKPEKVDERRQTVKGLPGNNAGRRAQLRAEGRRRRFTPPRVGRAYRHTWFPTSIEAHIQMLRMRMVEAMMRKQGARGPAARPGRARRQRIAQRRRAAGLPQGRARMFVEGGELWTEYPDGTRIKVPA
jgi:hypothetical protein